MRSSQYTRLASSLALALGLAGCGGADDDEASASADSVDTASSTASLLTVSADPAMTSVVPSAAATMAAARAGTYLQPPSCVQATATGATVNYTLTNCSGPYGLAQASGTVTAVFSMQGAAVGVALTGNLTFARGARLNVNASAVVTASGTGRTATVTTMSSGTGARGQSVTHNGSYTAAWDTAAMCLSLSGSFMTTSLGRSFSTTVANFRKCAGACPQSGTVAVSAAGRTVTLTYSGANTASWSSGSRSGTVALFCGS
ncbi:MAG: hypothetical protein HY909_27900 [Deltaproteobacteria bacterium]|nr:hypothetical protein [Deltaproteobacteria bacterium]